MSTWVPEDQRDTRYYIWYERYKCRMRYGDTKSIDDLQNYGIYSGGDIHEDRAMMNDITVCFLSINEIFEYWRTGIDVSIVDRADTKKIYDRISDHINAFRQEISASFSLHNVPLDDLVQLDQFASTVYEFAKHEFTSSAAHNLIARRMDELMGFTPDTVLGRPNVVQTTPVEEEEDNSPQRTRMEEFFLSHARRQSRGF